MTADEQTPEQRVIAEIRMWAERALASSGYHERRCGFEVLAILNSNHAASRIESEEQK